MKKTVFIALVLFAAIFSGCADDLTKPSNGYSEPPIKYNKVIETSGGFVGESAGNICGVKHFDYNGHSYIQFEVSATHGGRCGMVHDPDCKCNKNN